VARLYANENFPLPVVEALRRLGHDVVTMREAGRAEQAITDTEVLAEASSDRRAVLTLNRKHFVRLHHEQQQHEGIVACTFDADFERQAQQVHHALEAQPALTGQLLRVNRPAV
jgi:hypothetical protein